MAEVPVPEFPPIPATNPTVTPAVPAATYDQWYMTNTSIDKQPDGKYDLNVYWIEGNATAEGTKTTNYIVRDLLSQESLIDNPEIASIAPQLMAGLAAIGKRKGVL